MELSDYSAELNLAIEKDFESRSGNLSSIISDILADVEGFDIGEDDRPLIDEWWDHVVCGTWKDLIDWIWSILKRIWDIIFG